MKSFRVLLVEDNPLTRKIVRTVVTRENCQLFEATGRVQALAMVDEVQPHLVLLDLVLPDGSGFDVVTALRARAVTATTPILAFTGLLTKADESRLSNVGFDGLITKPIEPSRLMNLLRSHLSPRERETGRFGEGKRALLVDDDPQQLKLVRFRLTRLGFTVDCCVDGIEALEHVRRTRPDVVITDALMPRLDGFGLCRELRRDPATADLPIVLATSSYLEAEDKELARGSGASAYVVRDADLTEIVEALENVFAHAPEPVARVSPPLPTIEDAHAARTVRQLERQVALNSGLVQRCSTLSAELSVLSTVAEALVNTRNIESALFEILANCLDVAGASRGAIYVRRGDGEFALRASHGLVDSESVLELLGDLRARHAIDQADSPLRVRQLATALGRTMNQDDFALILPLRARSQLLGAMLLDAPTNADTIVEDWGAFAQAIGNQVSLALSLASAFERVETSDRRARTLMDSAADGVFVCRLDGTILELNRAAERLVGRLSATVVGELFDELVVADQLKAANGAKIPVESTSSIVEMGDEQLRLILVRDVSERNNLAEQLRQSQKMEAVGKLAGGVAHDFNNLLSIILSYSYLLMSQMPPEDPRVADLQEVQKAGERAAGLTQQLLAFSRHQVLQPRVINLNDAVQSSEKMFRRILGDDVRLSVLLQSVLGNVHADVGQIQQVLLNLVVNARDAMPRGGELTIETRNVDSRVLLTVTDSGSGIDTATLSRIFEPFFTTKEAGKGTGLGLATVFGIVQQSKGTISVDSELGKGTTFSVFLPRTDAAEIAEAPRLTTLSTSGKETILLVDDEDQLRRVMHSILRGAGYRVVEAPGPGEALLAAEQAAAPFDLLLTDLIMPRMNGLQLAERLAQRHPQMKFLLMSGYSDDSTSRHGLNPELPYLQKPIRPDTLLQGVRAALDGRAVDSNHLMMVAMSAAMPQRFS